MGAHLSARSERVLSIDPAYHGLGYAVIETQPQRLVAWGTKHCRRVDGSALAAIKRLISKYQPTVFVLPDWRDIPNPLRRDALEEFIEAIAEALTSPALPVVTCSKSQLREHFGPLDAHSKQEIAGLLGRQFPELRRSVPKKRQIWETEPPILSVFDAVAMAVACVATSRMNGPNVASDGR